MRKPPTRALKRAPLDVFVGYVSLRSPCGQPLEQVWILASPKGILVLAYRHIKGGGVQLESLAEGDHVAPLDSRYTQVGFNLIYVQGCER